MEAKIGAKIEPGGVIFSWLIPFCSDILNKFRVGADGRTAYERIVGHRCNVAQIGFCEVVDFTRPTKTTGIRQTASTEKGYSLVIHCDLPNI